MIPASLQHPIDGFVCGVINFVDQIYVIIGKNFVDVMRVNEETYLA